MYAQRSTFIVNYTGFTPEAQSAFQQAVDIWSRIVESDVPIVIDASFTLLNPGVLGSAGPLFFQKNFDAGVQIRGILLLWPIQ